MTLLRGGLMALILLAALAASPPAKAGCFWDGVAWLCWTHPLFPELSLATDTNPYRRWILNWGGPNWKFYGWEPM